MQHKYKLNQLNQILPDGLFVTAAWLEKQGYSRSLRKQYVDRGWLHQPVRGLYRRPGGPLTWRQVYVSLHTLHELPVAIGGLTALEIQGYAHYLRQSGYEIHLYSNEKLPNWLTSLPTQEQFFTHKWQRLTPTIKLPVERHPFTQTPNHIVDNNFASAIGLRTELWSEWEWPIVMSKPERAILELLDELPKYESFHKVDMIMEGLVNINPSSMQSLLEETTNVKVKRLFFYFADRHQHDWRKRLNKEHIDLGKGKRMLVKGGKLDPFYQITVPKDL